MNSVFKNWQIFPKYSMYLNKKQILYKRRLFNALLKKLKKTKLRNTKGTEKAKCM